MSETESDAVHVEAVASPKKAKRVLSADQLEKLKFAREKAREKKLELGGLRAREKALKDKLLADRIAALTLAEAPVVVKKKKKAETPPSSEAESTESEEEEEAAPRKRGRTFKRRAKAPPVKDDALAASMIRDELQARMLKQSYRQAFASLFPGKANIYA